MKTYIEAVSAVAKRAGEHLYREEMGGSLLPRIDLDLAAYTLSVIYDINMVVTMKDLSEFTEIEHRNCFKNRL